MDKEINQFGPLYPLAIDGRQLKRKMVIHLQILFFHLKI